jgi:hypothetical protein
MEGAGMPNRRFMLRSLAGVMLLGAGGCVSLPHKTKDVWGSDDAAPKATLVKGNPPILDFGDGLKIPMDKSAFLALWEGKDFWMTYGAGRERYSEAANGEAVHYAEGSMKLLLLTLAFAPERMVNIDGGWRLKEQNVKNYVRGVIDLPGKPFWPVAMFDGGMGPKDFASSKNVTDIPIDLNLPSLENHGSSAPDSLVSGNMKVDSFTAYYVKKKDVDLDYVRAHASVLVEKQ